MIPRRDGDGGGGRGERCHLNVLWSPRSLMSEKDTVLGGKLARSSPGGVVTWGGAGHVKGVVVALGGYGERRLWSPALEPEETGIGGRSWVKVLDVFRRGWRNGRLGVYRRMRRVVDRVRVDAQATVRLQLGGDVGGQASEGEGRAEPTLVLEAVATDGHVEHHPLLLVQRLLLLLLLGVIHYDTSR